MYCEEKELCMNTPMQAGIKTLSAASGLLAEIVNAFSEKLTLKALVVVTLGVLALLVCTKFYSSH